MDIPEVDKMAVTVPGEGIKPQKLNLNTLANLRKSTARIIRYLQVCPVDELPRYRVIQTYLQVMVSCYKMDFEDRLAQLETIIKERESEGKN